MTQTGCDDAEQFKILDGRWYGIVPSVCGASEMRFLEQDALLNPRPHLGAQADVSLSRHLV
jgi:hypothetical protein